MGGEGFPYPAELMDLSELCEFKTHIGIASWPFELVSSSCTLNAEFFGV